MIYKFFLSICFISCSLICTAQTADKDMLSKANEYFLSQKYHEALLSYQALEKRYKLTPRYKAQMALCHYKIQNYEDALKLFEESIPELEPFSPHERATYYYACAECYFILAQEEDNQIDKRQNGEKNEKYDTAAKFYRMAISVCYDKEKGDVYFKLGFCNLLNEEIDSAITNFNSAMSFYEKYGSMDESTSFRKKQTERMLHSLTHNASSEQGE